jgi:predicted enzyme related to lactoylglutathione lyase
MPARKRARKTAPVRRPARRPSRPKGKAPARAARKTAPRRRAAPARQAPRTAAAPARVANAIGLLDMHMDYTTHSVEDMRRFYTELLGFKSFQYDPGFDYLSVTTGPSSSLGFMPPMPGPPEQWRPPREPWIYLLVKNVDRAYRDLLARGATFEQEPTDMPWRHRVATLRDPEGRMVCLAHPLTP